MDRLLRRFVEVLNPYYQISSLREFNDKFQPVWLPRVLIYADAADLPEGGNPLRVAGGVRRRCPCSDGCSAVHPRPSTPTTGLSTGNRCGSIMAVGSAAGDHMAVGSAGWQPVEMALTDRFADPLADPAKDRSRLRFAAGMIAIGILHFVTPTFFRRIVPSWFPWANGAVLWSGVAEVASGALIAMPRTRRAGGALATATIAAVYPANIQMAVDSSRGKDVGMPGWIAWVRLPMQIPMLIKAWSFTR